MNDNPNIEPVRKSWPGGQCFLYKMMDTLGVRMPRIKRPYERELLRVNIESEYALIQRKESKLSAGMRREVIRRYEKGEW